jgi:hypothetical protein
VHWPLRPVSTRAQMSRHIVSAQSRSVFRNKYHVPIPMPDYPLRGGNTTRHQREGKVSSHKLFSQSGCRAPIAEELFFLRHLDTTRDTMWTDVPWPHVAATCAKGHLDTNRATCIATCALVETVLTCRQTGMRS